MLNAFLSFVKKTSNCVQNGGFHERVSGGAICGPVGSLPPSCLLTCVMQPWDLLGPLRSLGGRPPCTLGAD